MLRGSADWLEELWGIPDWSEGLRGSTCWSEELIGIPDSSEELRSIP